jgi:hypothetical protein
MGEFPFQRSRSFQPLAYAVCCVGAAAVEREQTLPAVLDASIDQ